MSSIPIKMNDLVSSLSDNKKSIWPCCIFSYFLRTSILSRLMIGTGFGTGHVGVWCSLISSSIRAILNKAFPLLSSSNSSFNVSNEIITLFVLSCLASSTRDSSLWSYKAMVFILLLLLFYLSRSCCCLNSSNRLVWSRSIWEIASFMCWSASAYTRNVRSCSKSNKKLDLASIPSISLNKLKKSPFCLLVFRSLLSQVV